MKLYVDTMVWVYFYEKHPLFHGATRAMFERSRAAGAQLCSSQLVLAELLVGPKRLGDAFTAARYRTIFQSTEIHTIPFTSNVTERFSDLRASTRVKTADALHLAFAAAAGVDVFVTYDRKLEALALPGIGRIGPPDLVS